MLIVAAYASVRAGLRALLADREGLVVTGEVGSREDLRARLQEASRRPQVVLLDGESGELVERVLALLSGTAATAAALVVLGDAPEEDAPRLAEVSSLRGWAYLSRNAEGPQIENAIRAAASGLIVFDRNSLSLPFPDTAAAAYPPAFATATAAPHRAPGEETLTPRETEVLQRMAEGLPNKIIAARLGISLHTVKFHVAQILAKLDASSRTEAVTLGARRGYVAL